MQSRFERGHAPCQRLAAKKAAFLDERARNDSISRLFYRMRGAWVYNYW